VCADRAAEGEIADGLRAALASTETFEVEPVAVEPARVVGLRALVRHAPRSDGAGPDEASALPPQDAPRGVEGAPERPAAPVAKLVCAPVAPVAVVPSNALLLVSEPSAAGRLPETLLRALGGAASSCLAFGALSSHGGAARVSLCDRPRDDVLGAPVFEAVLDTPGRRLAVYTVRVEAVLDLPVEAERTRVRIWAREPQAPADIEVVASRPGE
jgi:hypothetical protein